MDRMFAAAPDARPRLGGGTNQIDPLYAKGCPIFGSSNWT